MRSRGLAALATSITMLVVVNSAASGGPVVTRSDFRVKTEDGVRIFVRELKAARAVPGTEPLILVHGARVPGLGSFDLPVPGGSLAEDLVKVTGRTVYVMDARDYGGSDRSSAMDEAPSASPPQARAYLVVRDLGAVVHEAERRTETRTVTLLGWATGAMWAAYYASLFPERVGHLITLNALYGGSDRHAMLGLGSSVSDPSHPDRLSPTVGAYSLSDATSLLRRWDESILSTDKADRRDLNVAVAYERAALASDPRSGTRDPPALRAPTGAMEDSFYQATGRRLFDASSITAHVLVIRSERDFWSRPEDVHAFVHDAVHAADIQVLELPDATHFVHLERPGRGRETLIASIATFLGKR